jgi:orotate phosphoribosyltransferase
LGIDVEQEVAELLPWRKGHFKFESGHHADTWINLELLCVHPEPVERLADVLAERLAPHRAEAVCGPLVEGAFVGLMVAKRLGVPFTYTERFAPKSDRMFSVSYIVPGKLRELLSGKRVAIVNDVVSAGSAVLGTLKDLYECGADPVAIGALAARGPSAMVLAHENGLALEKLATFPGEMWKPSECPLCAIGMSLSDHSG